MRSSKLCDGTAQKGVFQKLYKFKSPLLLFYANFVIKILWQVNFITIYKTSIKLETTERDNVLKGCKFEAVDNKMILIW